MGGHLDPGRFTDFDLLGEVERGRVLRHVGECASCRAAWVEVDPSRLFALLDAAPVPEAALDRLTARINDEIDAVEVVTTGRGPRFGWASLAASLLLAVAIGSYLVTRPDVGGGAGVAEVVATQEEQFAGGGIEVMTPADADVYDLTVGETQIVMIFDEGLDI